MLQITVFVALAFAILIALFAVQNPLGVNVQILAWSLQNIAVSVLVLVSAALGAGVMLLLGAARELRLRLRHRAMSQQLKAAEARIRTLEGTVAAAQPIRAPALGAASSVETEPLPTQPISPAGG